MDMLILKDVRCFHGVHELPLAPLTILIGENSTGKSTILAATRLAWDVGYGVGEPDFNEEPFDWGAYDQIAHFRGGRGGRARTFVIGFERLLGKHRVRVEATFAQRGAQARLCNWQSQSEEASISVEYAANVEDATVVLNARGWHHSVPLKHADVPRRVPLNYALMAFLGIKELPQEGRSLVELLGAASRSAVHHRPHAIAPIRTKPRRTYDRRKETYDSEGEHVPMILAGTKSGDPEKWTELRKSLREFGSESGLFKSVNVKRLGRKESDPFQVQIGIAGPPTNLVDVGYGVSQVLPIAVDCLTTNPGQMLLMQQPEVHLHPRAQAELGSFMGYLVKERRNRFVIETHSDYLIDRVRLDVRDKKFLGPDAVSLLYCERKGVEVHAHRIQLDAEGNLLNPPPGYRRFFLEEEKRLFGG
jgi:hypothetical protein